MTELTETTTFPSGHHMTLRNKSQKKQNSSPTSLNTPNPEMNTEDLQNQDDEDRGTTSNTQMDKNWWLKLKSWINISADELFDCCIEFAVVFGLFFICCSLLHCSGNSSSGSVNITDNLLDKLKARYPEVKGFWKGVDSALNLCSRNEICPVLILHHDSNINCLAVNVAKAISSNRSISKIQKYYEVDGRKSQEFSSSFLEDLLMERDERGVVVFTHLEKLESVHAKALHYVCDQHMKKETKAVLLLVLEVDDKLSDGQDLDEIATNKIKDLWKTDLKNLIDPIVGRITANVVSIGDNSFQMKDCEN